VLLRATRVPATPNDVQDAPGRNDRNMIVLLLKN